MRSSVVVVRHGYPRTLFCFSARVRAGAYYGAGFESVARILAREREDLDYVMRPQQDIDKSTAISPRFVLIIGSI
jgi:hypothetical protein